MISFTPIVKAAELPAGKLLSFDMELVIKTGMQLLNIAVLSAVIIFILYNPVKKYMAARTERIKKEIEEANKERDDALALKEKYEKMIAGIENEREEILHQAYKKAMEKSDQLLFEARREAELMYDRALEDLETEKKNINEEMKKQMIEISTMMAGHFVSVSIDRDEQDRLIEEAFTDWEGA